MLLASLSRTDFAWLAPHLEHVTMPQGSVLHEVASVIRYVYFPTTALVSLVGLTKEGQGTEVGMIGVEGFCGIPIVFGGNSQQYASTIQMSGDLEKLAIHVLDERDGKTPLSEVMRGYALIQLGQITQSAICNRFHTLTQRLCRWLLTAADRVGRNKLELTQEYLSQMIGARRSALAEVVGRLQKKGFIRCTRGCVVLVQRAGVEQAACECYGLVKQQIDAFLSGPGFPRSRDRI